MTMGKVSAELKNKHAKRELVYASDEGPESKRLDLPYLVVNEKTQCTGTTQYRNGHGLRFSDTQEKQGKSQEMGNPRLYRPAPVGQGGKKAPPRNGVGKPKKAPATGEYLDADDQDD